MKNIESQLVQWVISKRWALIVISALFACATASGVAFLSIDSDLRVFFAKDDPHLLELEALENTYTKRESIIIIVAPKQGDVFSNETLTAVQSLTAASWQIPFSSRVDSITNFQHTTASNDELVVADFIEHPATLDENQLNNKRQLALSESLLVNRLLSLDAKTTGVVTNIIFADKTPGEVEQVAKYSRQLIDEYQKKYPTIDFYLTGSVMFDMAFSEVGQHDMTLLAPIMFLILALVVGFSVRSWVPPSPQCLLCYCLCCRPWVLLAG